MPSLIMQFSLMAGVGIASGVGILRWSGQKAPVEHFCGLGQSSPSGLANTAEVQWLLEGGANIEQTFGRDWHTALHRVAIAGQVEVFRMLLDSFRFFELPT